MVVRRRRKITKKRGHMKHMGENRRGAGNRGGRGRAGFGKRAAHRKHMAMKLGLLPGRDKGFISVKMKEKKKPKIITLEKINEILWRYKMEGKELKINVVEMGYEKVLGRGKLDFPAEITAKYFTEGAIKKIEAAGGRAIQIE